MIKQLMVIVAIFFVISGANAKLPTSIKVEESHAPLLKSLAEKDAGKVSDSGFFVEKKTDLVGFAWDGVVTVYQIYSEVVGYGRDVAILQGEKSSPQIIYDTGLHQAECGIPRKHITQVLGNQEIFGKKMFVVRMSESAGGCCGSSNWRAEYDVLLDPDKNFASVGQFEVSFEDQADDSCKTDKSKWEVRHSQLYQTTAGVKVPKLPKDEKAVGVLASRILKADGKSTLKKQIVLLSNDGKFSLRDLVSKG